MHDHFTWRDIEPLLELAVVLNTAYFTFRHANTYHQYASIFEQLQSLLEDQTIQSHDTLFAEIFIFNFRYKDFTAELNKSHRILDSVLVLFGYSVAVVFIFLLFIAISIHGTPISYSAMGVIFIVGYSPILVSLCVELYHRLFFNYLLHTGASLSRQAQDAITRAPSDAVALPQGAALKESQT